jgi:hypothetical protein
MEMFFSSATKSIRTAKKGEKNEQKANENLSVAV